VRIAFDKSDVTADLPRGLVLTNQFPLLYFYRLEFVKLKYELGNNVLGYTLKSLIKKGERKI
jgi:hypothetical protein